MVVVRVDRGWILVVVVRVAVVVDCGWILVAVALGCRRLAGVLVAPAWVRCRGVGVGVSVERLREVLVC